MNKQREFPTQLFADRVREIVNDTGLTVPEFAKTINASKNTVYDWINGVAKPSINTTYKICRKYHVSADWLLGLK